MSSVGYTTALISCLAFGSFAVPIKGNTANRVHIDPMVMQTYKTAMCFLTSWLVLALGERFTFTPWGLLSGLFWVPGGTAGIYAVRTAGLAVSQGTWSTLKILVAFVWGILIFEERVRSRRNAAAAILLMMLGLCGMSFFSTSSTDRQPEDHEPLSDSTNAMDEPLLLQEGENASKTLECEETHVSGEPEQAEMCDDEPPQGDARGYYLNKRQRGLLCAGVDGLWGGSILAPMKFARRDAEGLGFVLSFSIGASVVLLCMWAIRLLYHAGRLRSWSDAWRSLPSLHLRCMWFPGGTAGLLWSIGNLSSILTVNYIGEGVGYSIVQAQMLVAGLWGVLWYGEVRGGRSIAGWFLCACVTVAGVLLLSHEHIKACNNISTNHLVHNL